MFLGISAANCVSPHLACLRASGFCKSARANKLHDAYRMFALAAVTSYMVQQCVFAYQERANMDRLARVMFLLLCHITSIAKQLVFVLNTGRVNHIIAMLNEPTFTSRTSSASLLLDQCAVSSKRLQRAYSGTAVLTCMLWVVFPIISFTRSEPVEFYFWSGGGDVQPDQPIRFAVMLTYSYYVTTLVGLANTTMDAFIATLLHQCKTQLTILRMNFETIMERADAEREYSNEDHETIAMKLFVECHVHYLKICELCRLVQDTFGEAIVVQFTVGGWILCLAAYQLAGLSVSSLEFASTNMFLSCILTELFLYCYYGNEVTVESEKICVSLYKADWVRGGRRVRIALCFAMMRALRPLAPTAGNILPLSLPTFVTILKSSYTFFAVLRQTKSGVK